MFGFEMFGFVKRKPVVLINSDDTVLYDPTTVEVIDNRIDEKKDVGTCGIETVCYGQATPPDTIESLLNKFIEAGYDKPEVVIKGETMLDGSERWRATVDGEFAKVGCMFGLYSIETTTQRETEERVIDNLKRKLARTAKDETTITY